MRGSQEEYAPSLSYPHHSDCNLNKSGGCQFAHRIITAVIIGNVRRYNYDSFHQ